MTVQNSKITFTRKINNTICIFNFHKSSLEHHSEETLKQIATYQELAQYRILTLSVVIKKLLVQFLTLSIELVRLLLDIRHTCLKSVFRSFHQKGLRLQEMYPEFVKT